MRVLSASLAVLSLSATGASAAAFDAYRAACLDTGADLAKVRAAASSGGWAKLTDADREVLAPGNERSVEGWAITQGGQRYLVSIKANEVGGGAGDMSGANATTCTLSGPKGDDAAAIKSYADFLKRRPAGDENADGYRTAMWQMADGGTLRMHYYFGGAAAQNSVFSLSIVKK